MDRTRSAIVLVKESADAASDAFVAFTGLFAHMIMSESCNAAMSIKASYYESATWSLLAALATTY